MPDWLEKLRAEAEQDQCSRRAALRRDWSIALKAESEMRERLKTSRDGEAAREWWWSVAYVLILYKRGFALHETLEPAPAELLSVLGNLAGDLAVGKVPLPIEDARADGGGHAIGTSEGRDIGFAVAYLQAANGGIEHNGRLIVVTDPHPTKTVATRYDVNARTVRGWKAKNQPAFLGVNDIDEKILTSLMRKAAERYRVGGASHGAIARRANERAEDN